MNLFNDSSKQRLIKLINKMGNYEIDSFQIEIIIMHTYSND